MMGIGTQEIIILLLFLVAFVLFMALPFILRECYPNKLWVGILLCLVCGMGQFYLHGGLKYFIGIAIFFIFLKAIIGNAMTAIFIADIFSAGIMYWRFLKIQEKPWTGKV